MSSSHEIDNDQQAPQSDAMVTDAVIVTNPERGRNRRRVALSTLAALILVSGTAVGIHQLSSVRDTTPHLATPPTTPSSDTDSVDSDGTSNPATETVSETASVTSATSPSEAPVAAPAEPPALHLDYATPGKLAPSNITWTVLDAGTPEAFAAQFDSSQHYALTNLPSSSVDEVDEMALFEQVDGTWKRIPFTMPDDFTPVVSGDVVYGIGTGPAVPGGPAGSFGTFDIATGTWQLHELPEQLQPYSSDKVENFTSFDVTPVDGGAIVGVSGSNSLRLDGLGSQIDQAESTPIVDGNAVKFYTDCDNAAVDDAFARLSTDMTSDEMTNDEYLQATDEIYQQHCSEQRIDATEIGLSPGDLNALERYQTNSVWRMTADAVVPFDVPGFSPDDPANYVSVVDGVISLYLANTDAKYFTIGPDGSLTQVFADVVAATQGTPLSVTVGPHDPTLLVGVDRYLIRATPGAPTQTTDILSAASTPEMLDPSMYVQPVGLAGNTSVATSYLTYNKVGTLTEPTTLTDSGYSLQIDPQGSGYRVIDNATGIEPTFFYDLSTESGKVDLISYGVPNMSSGSLNVDTETSPATDTTSADITASDTTASAADTGLQPDGERVATFDIDWHKVPGLNSGDKELLITSTDGVNVAVTDVAAVVRDTLHLDENHTSSSMDFPTVVNGRIIVPQGVFSTDANDLSVRNVIVVGTPN